MTASLTTAQMTFARSSARGGGIRIDSVLVALTLGIVLLGLVMVTSASISIASQGSGEPFLYPPAVAAIIRDYLDGVARGESPPEDPLTARELEVVKLIAEGHTSDEIAAELVLSGKTVERHRANVLAKLGMRNRVELTRYAIRRGLVEP